MIYSKSRRTWLKHYNHLYLQRQRKKTTIPPIPKHNQGFLLHMPISTHGNQ
jgi:hypothetical protein